MNNDYLILKHLENEPGYRALQELWIHQVSEIEAARDKAASRGTESAWRYAAGKEAGFKLAMTALKRALMEIEETHKDDQEEKPSEVIDTLLSGLRGEKQ